MKGQLNMANDIFNQAAGYIEKNGWLQGDWVNSDANGNLRCCAAGAINKVVLGIAGDRADPDLIAFADFLSGESHNLDECDDEEGKWAVETIAVWNDSPERTQAEVVDALRRAAAS
jgi:hypothetical protein